MPLHKGLEEAWRRVWATRESRVDIKAIDEKVRQYEDRSLSQVEQELKISKTDNWMGRNRAGYPMSHLYRDEDAEGDRANREFVSKALTPSRS